MRILVCFIVVVSFWSVGFSQSYVFTDKIGIFFDEVTTAIDTVSGDTVSVSVDGYELLVQLVGNTNIIVLGDTDGVPTLSHPFIVSKSLFGLVSGEYRFGYRAYLGDRYGDIRWSNDPDNIYGSWTLGWYDSIKLIAGRGLGFVTVSQ